MSEAEGTQWYEQVWQTDEAKRKFEAGELGYRDARKLDRELASAPKAEGPPGVPTRSEPPREGPQPGDPGMPDPRDTPRGTDLGDLAKAGAVGVGKAASSALDWVTSPFATDGGKDVLKAQRKGSPFVAQPAPEGMKAGVEATGGVSAQGVPEYLARPAEEPAKDAGKGKTERTEKVSGIKEERYTGPKAPDAAGFPEWEPPAYAETAVDFELPDGRVVSATPTQMTAILATEKAKEVNSLIEAYRKEDDAARSGAMWAEIVRGIAAVAIAQYGLKHGTDMSGFQLNPIDWTAQQRERRAAMESKVSAQSDVYKGYTDAAKEAKGTQFDEYKAKADGDWRKFQANTAKYDAGVNAAKTAFEQHMAGKELAIRVAQLKLDQQKATQVKDDLTPIQQMHYDEMVKLQNEAAALDLKGQPEAAQAKMQAAFSAATELRLAGRPDKAGSYESWHTVEDPRGTVSRFVDGLFGNQAPAGTPRLKTYAERQRGLSGN